VGAQAGVADPGWSTGAAFFAAAGERALELYVANYLDTSEEEVLRAKKNTRWRDSVNVMDGPFGLRGDPDHYYENLGGGRFREATNDAGLVDTGKYYGYTVVATDIDNDGDQDLYVANDSNPNFLYLNDGKGHFEDEGFLSGSSLSRDGAAQASMGVDIADYNFDGIQDIVVTQFAKDNSTIYLSMGPGFFKDASNESGVGGPTFDPLNWGAAFGDFDLDGDLDLFIASGHIYPEVDAVPRLKESYRQKNFLFENSNGKFHDVTGQAGPGLQIIESSRGVAIGDVDNDGDLDLLVSNIDAVPNLLVNESPRRGRFLRVKLYDPGPNHFAIGAKLSLTAGGKVLIREVRSGGNYISQSDLRAHFGLGAAERAERLEIRWPDGKKEIHEDLPLDRELEIRRKP